MKRSLGNCADHVNAAHSDPPDQILLLTVCKYYCIWTCETDPPFMHTSQHLFACMNESSVWQPLHT